MNTQSKKHIEEAIKLLTLALSLDEEEADETPKSTSKTKVSAPKKTEKSASAKKEVEADSSSTDYTEEDLENMSYNDLKKLCKELGIPAIGSRTEIVEKILSGDTSDSEEEDDEEEAPAPKKAKGKTSAVSNKKAPAKKEEPEEDEEDSDEEDEEDSEETTLDLVKEATEDMSDEDIANLLIENGISAKGKRQALIDKLVKAIDEGIISLEDDDDEAEEEEEEKPTKKSSAKSKKAEEPEDDEEDSSDEEDDEEIEENPDVLKFSKKRKAAFDKRKKELISARKSGKLKDKAIKSYVSNYYDGEVDLEDLSADELFDHYLELISLTIDDDGEIFDNEESYCINDNVYCCGHPCDYDESTGEYTCSVCESVYSADDDE